MHFNSTYKSQEFQKQGFMARLKTLYEIFLIRGHLLISFFEKLVRDHY